MDGDVGTQSNDVWSALSKGVSDYFAFRTAKETARTTAAPSGTLSAPNANPFPGTFSNHPQNDTKAQPGRSPFASFGGNQGGIIVFAVVALVLLLLLFRR